MKNVEIIMDAHCYVFNREDEIGGMGKDLELWVNNRYGPDNVFENKSVFFVSILTGIVKRYRTHRYCKSYKWALNG